MPSVLASTARGLSDSPGDMGWKREPETVGQEPEVVLVPVLEWIAEVVAKLELRGQAADGLSGDLAGGG